MSDFLDFLWKFLAQLGGGPGPIENNLVRFGLPTLFWAVLLVVAWSRQRHQDLPREKLLVWGFGLGLAREAYMFGHMAMRIITGSEHDALCGITEPIEHTLALAAVVVVAGSFLRYILDDAPLSRRFLQIGLGATALSYLSTFLWWARKVSAQPEIRFHETWAAWLFHIVSSVLLAAAILILVRQRGWVRNIVSLALAFFFLSEFIALLNIATNRAHSNILCPVGNNLHIWAIPLLGYVYFREQNIEKRRAEQALEAYREHLEVLVEERTTELTDANEQLQREIVERVQAEQALEQLSRRNELILEAAGEGIFGIDHAGKHSFVNPAAARMLGYSVEELIDRPSHATWHHSRADGSPYPEEDCPIHAGYKGGVVHYGDDQVFWRKDGTNFPVQHASSPTYEGDALTGAVVVFRDITERKQAEAEITQRSAELAAQNAIAATISQSLDLDTILNAALERVLAVLEMEVGAIFLLDQDAGALTLQTRRGGTTLGALGAPVCSLPDTQCISGQAVNEMRPVVLDAADISAERLRPFAAEDDLQTLVSTPLVSKGRALGALTLGARRADAVLPRDLELLTSLGQQIGMAVDNAHLFKNAERWAEELALLHEVSVFLTSSLNPDTIYDQIAQQSAKLLGCQVALVFRWDEASQEAVGSASYGVRRPTIRAMRLRPQEAELLPDLMAQRESIRIEDGQNDDRVPTLWRKRFEIQAMLCVPVWGVGRALGFLCLIDQGAPRQWRLAEVDLVESFVNRAAIALENAHLHKQLEWAAALEERQRIAADMHDGLAQTLGYLGLRTDQAVEMLEEGRVQEVEGEFDRIRETIGRAMRDVRRSIASLQEPPPPRQPLQDWLSDIVGEFALDGAPAPELTLDVAVPLFVPPQQLEQILRVVQEALANASRHAEAQRISVALERQDERAFITVQDDGRGFDAGAPPSGGGDHFGLSIMRARAARIGGGLEVDSAPGQGTRVTLTWSLDDRGLDIKDDVEY